MSDGKIAVRLKSGESRILRTYGNALSLQAPTASTSRPDTVDLSNLQWKLEFLPSIDSDGSSTPACIELPDGVKAWTALNDSVLNDYAGTGIYTTTFELTKEEAQRDRTIDLGDVRESARVYINGKFVGCAWAVPFELNCRDTLREGVNDIRVEVTNLAANRIRALDRDGVKWRKFKEINVVDVKYKKTTFEDWETMPSGLNSGVRLISR